MVTGGNVGCARALAGVAVEWGVVWAVGVGESEREAVIREG